MSEECRIFAIYLINYTRVIYYGYICEARYTNECCFLELLLLVLVRSYGSVGS